jgi:hypothetical protein
MHLVGFIIRTSSRSFVIKENVTNVRNVDFKSLILLLTDHPLKQATSFKKFSF